MGGGSPGLQNHSAIGKQLPISGCGTHVHPPPLLALLLTAATALLATVACAVASALDAAVAPPAPPFPPAPSPPPAVTAEAEASVDDATAAACSRGGDGGAPNSVKGSPPEQAAANRDRTSSRMGVFMPHLTPTAAPPVPAFSSTAAPPSCTLAGKREPSADARGARTPASAQYNVSGRARYGVEGHTR